MSVKLTSLVHHGGSPARNGVTRTKPRSTPLARSATACSSFSPLTRFSLECRRIPWNLLSISIYTRASFCVFTRGSPSVSLLPLIVARSFSFLSYRVWSPRPFPLSPSAFLIYAPVPGDIFQRCSKVQLSPCRSFLVRSKV